ncbi:multidrug effflux MFS transporter [Xinfangfangia sp. CPCC 101601]|uniref:Bcr/CflA family efflux transporter n=1 Tax=Pseudogemmobacter lacusdianii TaxID=3069608 RepID=A0ABU0VV76_9RHOB|nr:multidrug effflux MFS transporter [Xinfangfangia sp. CPCC 101601]MDQ2065428.1 multidrug effflux MFS transporter [Xinfangfangia sp. CPCC 101601]
MTEHIPSTAKRLSQGEFIALIAMLFATIAFSIDAMLPAEPAIAAALSPEDPNRAKLVVGAFFLGMGIGTFVSGPLSDAFGRKPVMIWGGVLYCIASLACIYAQSLDMLLLARVVQGIGGSAPRVVSLALVRDLYKGREMARIMSFAMMIFMLAPAVAPLLGQQIIFLAGWKAIFVAFILFSVVSLLWLGLRQGETLPPAARTKLTVAGQIASLKELFSHRVVVVSVMIQALTTAVLVAMISSVQGIYAQEFGREAEFPMWFALAAVLSAVASFLNAKLVMRMGMRSVARWAYIGGVALTLLHFGLYELEMLTGTAAFISFFLWQVTLFVMMGLTMGNLNALAMEPVGHIAGFAASLMAAVSTVLAVVISTPIAQAFDGTHQPLVVGALVCLIPSTLMMRLLGKPTKS